MADPFGVTAVGVFLTGLLFKKVGEWLPEVVEELTEDGLKSLYKKLASSPGRPQIPTNHDLLRAGGDSFRQAAAVVLLEASRSQPDSKPLFRLILDHIKEGKLFKIPLIEAGKNPQLRWLNAALKKLQDPAFDRVHDTITLQENELLTCVTDPENPCFSAKLAEALLKFLRELPGTPDQDKPRDLQQLLYQGWTPEGQRAPVTIGALYCLFFRERLKHKPEVFNIAVINLMTLHKRELLEEFKNLAQQSAEQTALLRKLADWTPPRLDFTDLASWLTPRLDTLDASLGELHGQMDALLAGNRDLAERGTEMLSFLLLLRGGQQDQTTLLAELKEALQSLAALVTQSLGRGMEHNVSQLRLVRPQVVPPPGKIPGKPPSDLWVLDNKCRVTELLGREAEMGRLIDWALGPAPICIQVVSGAAGSGKTRLGCELIWRLDLRQPETWQSGFLSDRELRRFNKDNDWASWDWSQPLLIVVDYAQPLRDQLKGLVETLCLRATDGKSRPPCRLLLIEREASMDQGWLKDLREINPSLGGCRAGELFARKLVGNLPPLPEGETRRGLLVEIARSLAHYFKESPILPPDPGAIPAFDEALNDPRWGEPIYPIMAALVARHHGRYDLLPNASRIDLAKQLALREAARLARFEPGAPSGLPFRKSWVAHLAAFVVASGQLPIAEARSMLAKIRDLLHTTLDVGQVVANLAQAMPDPGNTIAPLQPDLIAEAYLLALLPQSELPVPSDSSSILLQIAKTYPQPAAKRLFQAWQDFNSSEADRKLLFVWLEALKSEAVNTSSRPLLEAMEASLPHQTTQLRELAVDLDQALLGMMGGDEAPEKARILNNLAVRLGDLGRREEALQAATEALELYRKLARARPEAFEPDVAMSLNNQATVLSGLGRREEALQAATEALELYRKLARARPEAFEPDLAGSLNTQANMLSGLGRREEALQAATEALEIRRKLARARPEAFEPDLARTLGATGMVLVGMGRHAEAADRFHEGMGLLLKSFEKSPQAFAPMMRRLAKDYLESSQAAQQEPDMALLGRVEAGLQRLSPDA